jgi:hypothetical protein
MINLEEASALLRRLLLYPTELRALVTFPQSAIDLAWRAIASACPAMRTGSV